ncbi:MAG TPA: hypothetical protein VIM86_06540 [Thermodesulfobacteriota bacterium]
MVCPRDPATCPETWPVGSRLLCGSFEMLARFEKAGGGDDLENAEAGFADALGDLSIRTRLDADPDDQPDEIDDSEGEDR